MDTLNKIKDLVEKISIDSKKTMKGNHTASVRARRNAQELKLIIPKFRKEILDEIRTHDNKKKQKKMIKKNEHN
jgi:hypothetical protein